MIEGTIEQQAIRAALALAAASSRARTPDSIADMREEATQLIGLCIHKTEEYIPFHAWCDNAVALLERASSSDALPEQEVLRASAAVLRLRLIVSRYMQQNTEKQKKHVEVKEKKVVFDKKEKRILEFISEHPDIRTKNLVAGLASELSARTIKRCLKVLIDSGSLQRAKLEDGGVSYRV
jgi:hypothetical protein